MLSEWIVTDWAPHATAQGLTDIANVVSSESLAALSAEAMQMVLSDRLQMRMFGTRRLGFGPSNNTVEEACLDLRR